MDTSFLFSEKFYADVVTFRVLGEDLERFQAEGVTIDLGNTEELIADIKRFGQHIKLNFPEKYDPYVWEEIYPKTLIEAICHVKNICVYICERLPITEEAYQTYKQVQNEHLNS